MNFTVLLYTANLIDYSRLVLLILSSFYNGIFFGSIYALSVALDCFDGMVARKFNQTSKLGACLDMGIDRASIMLISFKIISEQHNQLINCAFYSIIDFISHFIYYVAMANNNVSHKSFADNILLSFYYKTPLLFTLCLGSELFLLATYLQKYKIRTPFKIFYNLLKLLALIKTIFHIIHFAVGIAVMSDLK